MTSQDSQPDSKLANKSATEQSPKKKTAKKSKAIKRKGLKKTTKKKGLKRTHVKKGKGKKMLTEVLKQVLSSKSAQLVQVSQKVEQKNAEPAHKSKNDSKNKSNTTSVAKSGLQATPAPEASKKKEPKVIILPAKQP